MSHYVLHLYVTERTSRSLQAVSNLRRICEEHLGTDYELVQIDVEKRPDLAEAANIFATPATVRVAPLPQYRIIGDLSDSARVLAALGIDPAGPNSTQRKG